MGGNVWRSTKEAGTLGGGNLTTGTCGAQGRAARAFVWRMRREAPRPGACARCLLYLMHPNGRVRGGKPVRGQLGRAASTRGARFDARFLAAHHEETGRTGQRDGTMRLLLQQTTWP